MNGMYLETRVSLLAARDDVELRPLGVTVTQHLPCLQLSRSLIVGSIQSLGLGQKERCPSRT